MAVKLGLIGRFLRWLSDFFWPGDYDKEVAKGAFKVYASGKDREELETALSHFKIAVDLYRKHGNQALATTLINYASAVWKHYEDCGQSPEDLQKVIDLDTEAQQSWSGEKEKPGYLALLSTLAKAYFEQYQKSIGNPPIRPERRPVAFENAVQCFTELKNNEAAEGSRSDAQVQLGVLFRMRCDHDRNLDGFDVGIQQLQEALSEAATAREDIGSVENEASEERGKELDAIEAKCYLNIAEFYEIRYSLGNNPRTVHDLTMAIDANTSARPFLEKLQDSELPGCLFNLARQLRQRWIQTQEDEDYRMAYTTAEEASKQGGIDEPLKMKIEELLRLFHEPPSRQGTLDSIAMGGPSGHDTLYNASNYTRMPQRHGTVTSMDGQ